MTVRKTTPADLSALSAIFQRARAYMAQSGNPNQWKDNRPSPDRIAQDIAAGNSYVVTDPSGAIVATFALIFGEDPTYAEISGGSWLTHRPYATIHRLASSGRVKGMGDFILNWCRTCAPCLRADTHQDNAVMRHLLERHQFVYCGIIYVDDGTPRLAYETPPEEAD